MEEILNFFPEELQQEIKLNEIQSIEEIRIRTGKPVIIKNNVEEKIVKYIISQEVILQILQKICDNSIYSYQNQICSGFITLKGGHRVGITGNVVMKENEVINISYVSSLNFRIARQVIDCSNSAIKHIINIFENSVYNTLIVSPPGCGKTTILRDLVRKISNGIPEINFKGITVGVADERSEISAMYKGVPQNDIGIRTDVLDNIQKSIGMKMLIRSMNPKVIVADEIGKKEDIEAIEYAVCSGVKGIFTAHGSCIQEIIQNPILNELYQKKYIEKFLILDKNRNVKEENTKEEKVNVCI